MDKTIIYETVSEIKILSARHLLDEAGIENFVFNKKDSAYTGLIGDIELHVAEEDKKRAYEILLENGIIEE